MIFVGDIASPFDPSLIDAGIPTCFSGLVIGNLEGPLVTPRAELLTEARVFNHPAVANYLQRLGCGVVSLANNHILDVPGSLKETLALLRKCKIHSCGAGFSFAEASAPAIVTENGVKRIFLAFGWKPIGCHAPGLSAPGVNLLQPQHVLNSVIATRKRFPDSTIVTLMHWNYELEAYPLPMERALARAVIDKGASAVIGCHSHCAQGIELYRGAPIVYGLGNWFFAQGTYWSGRLKFPALAQRQLAFEWLPETNAMVCHWFDYRPLGHDLKHFLSEPLMESEQVRTLTPFNGMDHASYITWFRAHRRKRLGLPVYKNYQARFRNGIRDKYIFFRQLTIRLLLTLGLKRGPR